ncbi:uncharacterized protein LOC100889330 [Strongylocentrotus purpuratus]|uniref:Uncharacterized protein n=1 Tax=Strongylocentrotus purpuratus TaxID=7668 RepID=A0A7M7NNA4_STRPU|nr:uncharacterized protein LOC100889330 [Strongylocentrotus purpuratus]
MVIITVFVFMRRRSRDPKVTEPVDEDDDDPNLYNNPVYCSKDDGLPVPDLIVSTNSHISSSSQARQPLNDIDNQYEECEGDRHPVTNADGYLSHHDALSDTHSLPQKDLQNGGKQGQLDGPAVLDDEEEYNALTFNQSSDITRALKKPTSGGEGVNNGYGVLDLPEQEDSKLSVNSPQLHAGPGPKTGPYERDQPGDESEYHSYQDPMEMNQDGSARTPTELDVFSSDNYNILNSGKEVGDYHVYQATDDTGGDEGNYEDLDAKMSREDEYSEIDQSQNHAPGTTDKATFEPIYSDEVYSEFQGN